MVAVAVAVAERLSPSWVTLMRNWAVPPDLSARRASNTGSRDRWFGSGSVEEFADRLPHPVVRNAGRTGARAA
ncbi:hypothetical protein GCM10010207_84510 [Streptomyces atratus]|nr:hypothetical protein GCM10010207_84510 [Streptomyces atratus]